MTADPRLARRATAVVLGTFAFLCVYFTGVFPPWANPNELSRFQTVVAMAEWKTFSIDEAVARLGDHEDKSEAGGRLYSNKAPGLAFAAYPVYRILRVAFPLPDSGTANPIFILTRLLTVSVLCGIALRRFAARMSEAAAAAEAVPLVMLAVALGTPFLFYARSFFSHAWAASLLFLAWDQLRRSEQAGGARGRAARFAALAGFLAAWAAISEYTVAPVALALAVRMAAGRSGRRVFAFALAAAVPVALLLGYDAACFGSPWTLSSAKEAAPEYAALARQGVFGFSLPSARIAAAYLLDPARGVFVFSPFFLWSFAGLVRWWKSRRARADWWFVVAALGLLFVSLSGYPNWHGGWSLGSRYLLPGVFFAALPLAWALDGPLSRGLFVAATAFSVVSHALLTSAWPHFPVEIPWPAATGSLWFLAHGWVAPNLGTLLGAGPALSLLPALALTLWALVAASRAAAPVRPAASIACLIGVAPLVVLTLRPPELPYFGRLWRAGVLGAFSGRDDARQELGAVVLEASTPEQKRLAVGIWRWLGPRPGAP
jgi:hypothetical protein